jgi:WD40 repeat protein
MAWLGRSDEALRVLTDLKGLTNMRLAEPMIATTTHGLQLTNSDKLLKLSDDAHCFIRVNRYIADQAPLQIYASALVFAPECSPVKSLFKICMPRWLAIPPKVARVWDDDTLVLEGHTDGVIAMAFSTGDEYFVTSSRQDIRVWEPATGLCILKLPRPEGSHPVGGVCFSHDSRYFATAYKAYCDNQFESGTWISVYGTKTGAAIKCFRAGIPYWSAIRLAFTPDAHDILLVAFRYKGTLEMWRVNIKSGVTE